MADEFEFEFDLDALTAPKPRPIPQRTFSEEQLKLALKRQQEKLQRQTASQPAVQVLPAPQVTPSNGVSFKTIAIVGALLIALPSIVAAIFFIVSLMDDGETSTPHSRDTRNPGTYYIVNVAEGFAAVCDIVIEKANADEFNDLGDVEAIFAPSQSKVRDKALLPFKTEVFDELNGDKFSNEKVAELFTKMKQGYLEAIQ